MAQPQLLKMALDEKDIVYTPDWVAQDMVEFFKPSGRILEPCKGAGVFLKYLPKHTEWCEIQDGRDFFAWNEPVDWVFGNPPYSAFGKWVYHAMSISKNVVYLAPAAKPFYSEKMLRKMIAWGMLAHSRAYGGGAKLNFPIGFLISALHFKKGYKGGMFTSVAVTPSN